MTELLIGVCHGLAPDKIHNWVVSSRSCGFSGDVALIGVDATATLADLCAAHNVALTDVSSMDPFFLDHPPSTEPLGDLPHGGIRIHHQRYLLLHRYLSQASSYELVVTTDVRDVVFQQNPFARLRALLDAGAAEILIGSENIRFKDEPWNSKNLGSAYPFLTDAVACDEPVCSGVIGGRLAPLRDFLMLVYLVTRNFLSEKVSDQAGVNALLHLHPFSERVAITRLTDAWVCHLGVSGPTDQHKDQGYDRNLLEASPALRGDMVVTAGGEAFDIVHQYERIPAWNEAISRKYRE